MREDLILATLAQAGVALAGFSGIVVALGERARGQWSSRERQLLTTLLGTSGLSALLSVVPLALSSARVPEPQLWLTCSAAMIAFQVQRFAARLRRVMTDTELRSEERALLAFVFVGEGALFVLQILNCVWLSESWPFLVGLIWHLILSFLVFIRLVQPPRSKSEPMP